MDKQDFYTLNDEKTHQLNMEKMGEKNSNYSALMREGILLCNEKYRLEKQAGAGGMGIVWKAWDLIGERTVALKFLPIESRQSDSALGQLKRTFQTIQSLSHPHICPIYALERDENFGYFVVMRWLEGHDLSEISVSPAEIPEILLPIAQALDYAHSLSVIHRDVKPTNIFLETGENGRQNAWLIDFGISSPSERTLTEVEEKGTSRTSGTLPFMPPEQWQGRTQDGRTDQYSLAVVAYKLYAGRLPFWVEGLELLRLCVLNDTPEIIENVPQYVNFALQRALAKNRKERFDTCEDFVRALMGTETVTPSVLTTVQSTETIQMSQTTQTPPPRHPRYKPAQATENNIKPWCGPYVPGLWGGFWGLLLGGFLIPMAIFGFLIAFIDNNVWIIGLALIMILFSFASPLLTIRWCYEKAHGEKAPPNYGCGSCLICFVGGIFLSIGFMNPLPFLLTFVWFCYVAVHPKKVE